MSLARRTRTDDYLAAIDQLGRAGAADRVSTGAIAEAIGVAKGTASGVLKTLAEQGLIDLRPYAGSRLTETGLRRARIISRRYRLLEMFLQQTLAVPAERLADEAWSLEPGVSEELLEMIDRWLRRPEFDARGDPVPRADGSLPTVHPG